ncbi:MAG: DUF5680 domain-containing protein [Nanoarchaeota archaeon]
MDVLLNELNEFLGKSALATYAGGAAGLDPEKTEKGMNELEYGNKEDEWYYKDSYAGFFQSWGREVVWHNQKPFWVQIYGGGMEKEYFSDAKFVHETFGFLKKAMSAGDKVNSFQPRGPNKFSQGDWEYICNMIGDIKKFKGSEKISFKGKVVFTHDFVGGLFEYRD